MSRNLFAADSPAFIVLNHEASIDKIGNSTTAYAITTLGRTVGVSFRPADPPQPSEFVLHFPGLEDGAPDKNIVEIDKHSIIATHRGVALVQLSVCNPVIRRMDDFAHEHFVYCASSTGQRQSLYLIPGWPESLLDIGGGYSAIFSDCYERFNIVALRPRSSYEPDEYQYDLCLFSSETATWTKEPMKLQPPTKDEELWQSVWSHLPCKVITLEGGSVCWIDLSCGILFCNKLFCPAPVPEIRYVPLPKAMLRDKTSFIDTACSFRDISGYHGNEIRFVHVENMMRWDYGYKISFWTKDLSLEEDWDERVTHVFSMQYLKDIDLKGSRELDLNYVLSTAVPRLSLQDYIVHLISKECSGVVIDVDISDIHNPKMYVADHGFCTRAISFDPLSCWLVPSPCLVSGKEGCLQAADKGPTSNKSVGKDHDFAALPLE